jgi:hypothetical protein
MYNIGMNFMKKNWHRFILLIYVFFMPMLTLAQTTPSQPTAGTTPSDPSIGKIVNPLAGSGINNLPDLIVVILKGAIKIGIPVIALAIIYSGFLFVAARGTPEKINDAKRTLMYTLIGAAILLGAVAIAEMISATILAL